MNRIIQVWVEQIRSGENVANVGLRVCANVSVPLCGNATANTIIRVTSPGLWDVDSPDDKYRAEIIHEEADTLWYILKAIGCDEMDIHDWKKAKAMKVMELWDNQVPNWSKFACIDAKEVDGYRKRCLTEAGAI